MDAPAGSAETAPPSRAATRPRTSRTPARRDRGSWSRDIAPPVVVPGGSPAARRPSGTAADDHDPAAGTPGHPGESPVGSPVPRPGASPGPPPATLGGPGDRVPGRARRG